MQWGKGNKGPGLRNRLHPGVWETQGAVPRTPAGASKSPALPPPSPTTRSPTCTLLLDQFCCNVFYEHADGMARARGKVLPWDKKLTLANSKFTACIFIFLIPAPSVSNWGSTSLFSPLFLQPAFFFFFMFSSRALQPLTGVGFSHPIESVQAMTSSLQPPHPGQGTPYFCLLQAVSSGGAPANSKPRRGDTNEPNEKDKLLTSLHSELRQLNTSQLDPDPRKLRILIFPLLLTGII